MKEKTLQIVPHCSIIWGCTTISFSLLLYNIKQSQCIATYVFFFARTLFYDQNYSLSMPYSRGAHVISLLYNIHNFDRHIAIQVHKDYFLQDWDEYEYFGNINLNTVRYYVFKGAVQLKLLS